MDTDIFTTERWENITDPWRLGKARSLTDPTFRNFAFHWTHKEVVSEVREAEINPTKKLRWARSMLSLLGYGCTSTWPPLDPGMCHEDFYNHTDKQFRAFIEKWVDQMKILSEKGPKIARVLQQVDEGEFPGIDLASLMKDVWRKARDDFNREHAIEPDGILPGFKLDPDGEISIAHGCDLDNFLLDFVDDVVDQTQHNHTPIFRNGVNYKDSSEAFTKVREGDETAWEQLKTPPRMTQGNIAYNIGVRKHLERVRASYLVPHINLEDLSNLSYLYKFIISRGASEPYLSLSMDSDLMYLGMSAKILVGVYTPHRPVSFLSGDDPETGEIQYRIRLWKQEDYTDPEYIHEVQIGNIWGTMEAWLAMQSGIISSLFLYHLYNIVLGMASEDLSKQVHEHRVTVSELLDIKSQMVRELGHIMSERDKDFKNEGWKGLASMRQYEHKQSVANLLRYVATVQSNNEEATKHLLNLFNDPDYFAEIMIEQKEHHWSNLTVDYKEDRARHIDKYETTKTRHELYYDCLRRVLRRAIFGHFIWNLINDNIEAYQAKNAEIECIAMTRLKEEDPEWFQKHQGTQAIIWCPEFRRAYIKVMSNDEAYANLQDEIITVIRYCAVLFLKEFQSGLLHVSSEPIRDHYSRISQSTDYRVVNPGDPDKCPFPKGLYHGPEYRAKPTRTTLHIDHDDLPRLVGELINNFIVNRNACLYIGVRKVTERLRRYLEDCDSEESSGVFTPLVADTIDRLDILAEISQHLEDCWPGPTQDVLSLPEHELLKKTSAYCLSSSVDLVAFDDFAYEVKGVPEKRIERIFRFLDEVQGFSPRIVTFGEARGDLKRLGASLLKNYIVARNETNTFKTSSLTLKTLELVMNVSRDQYPFHLKETPVDLDVQDKLPRRKLTERWRGEAKRIKRDNKKRIETRRKRLAAEDKSFAQAVYDQDSRLKMMEQRQQRELERWRRVAQKRRKEKWNARAQSQRELELATEDEMEVDMGEELAGQMQERLNVQVQHPIPPVVQVSMGPPPRPVAPRDLMPPPLRPIPQQQPLPPTPQPHVPPEIALAPDGRPRALLHKKTWTTLQSIYGVQAVKVTWSDLVKVMNSLGYRDEGRGGSHGVFTWTEGCRWPHDALAKGRNIQLAKNHEGERKGASRGKAKDWGFRLGEREMTWDFVRKWYQQKR